MCAQMPLRMVSRHHVWAWETRSSSKTSGEVVAALAEKSGALAIPQEYAVEDLTALLTSAGER